MNSFKKYSKRIKKKFPNYKFSWEILTDIILDNVSSEIYWLDIGAGPNILIKEQPGAKLGVGLDKHISSKPYYNNIDSAYCLGDSNILPFKDNSFDFITSRYSFEHLKNPQKTLTEVERLLKPNGLFVMQTTNINNPFIKFSSLLPTHIKKAFYKKIFTEIPFGLFKTYYKINKPKSIPSKYKSLELEKLILTEDILCHSIILYLISMTFYHLIKLLKINSIKNNMIAIYRKNRDKKSRNF